MAWKPNRIAQTLGPGLFKAVIVFVVGYRNVPETWSVPTRDGSAVDLAAVGDLEHQHHQLTVLEIADQPVVAYPIAPQAGEVGS